MMLYQTKALGFKLTKGGVVAGLPWASRVLFAFFFGWAGDVIKRKQWMTVTALRKSATIFCKTILDEISILRFANVSRVLLIIL